MTPAPGAPREGMSSMDGTHMSLDLLGLQGLGSQCFPVPTDTSSISWLEKKGFSQGILHAC